MQHMDTKTLLDTQKQNAWGKARAKVIAARQQLDMAVTREILTQWDYISGKVSIGVYDNARRTLDIREGQLISARAEEDAAWFAADPSPEADFEDEDDEQEAAIRRSR